MNIYNAILAAADHIEQKPNVFSFAEIAVPNDCGSPGCVIGWTAFFSGQHFERDGAGIYPHHQKQIALVHHVCRQVFGVSHWELYCRLDSLVGCGWRFHADKCVAALRLYAEKYHKPKHTGIPASVLALFDPNVAAIAIDKIKVRV